jgi:hypothetical protein
MKNPEAVTQVELTQQDLKEAQEISLAKLIADIIRKDEITPWNGEGARKKTILLENLSVINKLLQSEILEVESMSSILEIFSKNNILDYYDYAWRYEEKNTFLQESVLTLMTLIEKKLFQDKKVSIASLCRILFNLSTWKIKPTPVLVDKLLLKIHLLFQEGAAFSLQAALYLLDGVCFRLRHVPKVKIDFRFFLPAIQLSLPTLLATETFFSDGAKPKMFEQRSGIMLRQDLLCRLYSSRMIFRCCCLRHLAILIYFYVNSGCSRLGA